MELNQSNNKSQDIFNLDHKIIDSRNKKNANYLYPNEHRITNQMKRFKASRDRVLNSNIAA